VIGHWQGHAGHAGLSLDDAGYACAHERNQSAHLERHRLGKQVPCALHEKETGRTTDPENGAVDQSVIRHAFQEICGERPGEAMGFLAYLPQ
jgi:hypothetical protein